MMEILHLFREQEIREELGVGTVRDAFSDILFPGTSTLHTRPKYMLLIPWIFLKLEESKISSEKIMDYARWYEIKLINTLLEAGESDGVIGKVAKDTLKILPSYMYWSGLGRWGIRVYDGSIDQYFRSLDSFYLYKKSVIKSDDNEFVTLTSCNWDPYIVPMPKDFPGKATLSLTKDEAEYLMHRILANCSGSVIAFLVNRRKPVEVEFIWLHPEYSSFSESHKIIITHARNFSEVIHGASLLYNYMLAQKARIGEKVEEYARRIKDWAMLIENRINEIHLWEIREFWRIVFSQNSRINILTRRFIENWIGLVRSSSDLSKLANDEKARQLIYQREIRIKGKRSRLKNPRMLAQWSGASGASALDFRWHIARTIVADISQGMRSNKR